MREFDLLNHIYAANDRLDARVEIPPGDDMAALRLDGSRLLAAVDQLVDGRHVRLETTPIELVGRKAVTRCLSDVAAMAARPVATLAAVVLPTGFGDDRARALFDAVRATAATYGGPLVGGDLAVHATGDAPLVCAITILAEPGGGPPVTRSGARPGDGVYVTGALGATLDDDGLGHHLTFEPRIAEALALADALGPRLHAMIDLSDGLGRDAAHLAADPSIQLRLDADRVPCRTGATVAAALGDGEDYELCFSAPGPVPERLGAVPVTRVGEVVARATGDGRRVVLVTDARETTADDLGWQHDG